MNNSLYFKMGHTTTKTRKNAGNLEAKTKTSRRYKKDWINTRLKRTNYGFT